MKKITFISVMIITSFLCTSAFVVAQSDTITKHNGETISGTVIRITEYTVVFSYDNETAENTIGKYAIEKIIYGKSRRTEKITDKIIISGEQDWEKVILLEEKSYITGLKKIDEIRGKTSLINLHSGNTGDKKALKKLKTEAAKLKCPFILVTSDKSTVGAASNILGGSQNIKTGLAYSY